MTAPDVAARVAAIEALSAELARHRDVIELVDRDGVPDGNGDRFRYGCTCGHERGTWTERGAVARLKQSWQEQRDHVAGALGNIAAERAAEAWHNGYDTAVALLMARVTFRADDDGSRAAGLTDKDGQR